ncbi:hypothetical protein H0H87_006940 [Tephrocybe sp. NHM501043]|nr:hypothetical protein H0H87_006940 [Tephrocybe sp. NHM501043]
MAKVKKTTEPTQNVTQHTSTSKSVKLRPRKRATGGTINTQSTRFQKVEEKGNTRPITRSLCLAHLDELYRIWDEDKRIPTVESRREWAAARNIVPQDVHRFFSRQKYRLKKSHRCIPKGTYDMVVGIPPVIKEEEEVSAIKPRGRKPRSTAKIEAQDVYIQSKVPTSDTLVALPSPVKKEHIVQELRFSSPLPPSSPLAPSSPTPDSDPDTHTLLVFPSVPPQPQPPITASAEDAPVWCHQDLNQKMEASTPWPAFDASLYSHLSLSWDSSLMELSALPFIDRSPDLMRRRSAVPDSTQWFFDHFMTIN